jgi:hypothetical protein
MQLLLWIYLLGMVGTMLWTARGIQVGREMSTEDDDGKALWQEYESTKDLIGLKDSGIIVLMGLLWPYALYLSLTWKGR